MRDAASKRVCCRNAACHTRYNLTTMVGLSRSVLGLARLFMRYSPQLVVATGGYASAPAGMFAVAAGVPLAVQEQNSSPGLTVRMLARFAAKAEGLTADD